VAIGWFSRRDICWTPERLWPLRLYDALCVEEIQPGATKCRQRWLALLSVALIVAMTVGRVYAFRVSRSAASNACLSAIEPRYGQMIPGIG
jgi:hypothetical protein